jgi:hypothetical protein
MLQAAREVGLKLFVTDGVIEEVYAHIYRSRGYLNAVGRGEAVGLEPFLLGCYRLNGRDMGQFDTWLETFCGANRPEDDLAEYFHQMLGIQVLSLDEYVQKADEPLRAMIREIWHEARDERDRRQVEAGGAPLDFGTRHKLVSHDVENYLGTQMRGIVRRERLLHSGSRHGG